MNKKPVCVCVAQQQEQKTQSLFDKFCLKTQSLFEKTQIFVFI